MMQFAEAVKSIFNDMNAAVLPTFVSFGKPKEGETRKRLPSSLSLDGQFISEINFDNEVFEITENIKSIHLNNNSLRSWDDVISILQNIPSLESLNLSSNPLALYQQIELPKDYLFPKLKVLILNDTNARWEIVLALLQHLPNIEALHLSLNKQTLTGRAIELTRSEPYRNLRELYYTSNDCSDLNELILMGDLFPSLETLVLLNNGLVSLLPRERNVEESFLHRHFSNLTALSISNNLISDWESIDYLPSFEKLVDLRIASQPLFENFDQEVIWNELVSRLDNVSKLNGSIIDDEIRCKAQRAFMRFYLGKAEKPIKFEELRQIHGDICPLIDIDLAPVNVIEIKVLCGNKSIETSVDVRRTVGEIKKSWCQQFGIEDGTEYNLTYWDHEAIGVMGPERLTFPNRKLFAYKVAKDDWFSLDYKFP